MCGSVRAFEVAAYVPCFRGVLLFFTCIEPCMLRRLGVPIGLFVAYDLGQLPDRLVPLLIGGCRVRMHHSRVVSSFPTRKSFIPELAVASGERPERPGQYNKGDAAAGGGVEDNRLCNI